MSNRARANRGGTRPAVPVGVTPENTGGVTGEWGDDDIAGLDPATGVAVPREYDRPGLDPLTGQPQVQQPQPEPFVSPYDAIEQSDLGPLEKMGAQGKYLAQLGVEYRPPTAAVPEGWVDQARTGAVPDFFAKERQDLYAREHGLTRDEEARQMDVNAQAYHLAQEHEKTARQQYIDQQNELAEIDSEYRKEKSALDQALSQQRALAAKGISPFAALAGGDNEGFGRATAAFSMAMAVGSGSPTAVEGLNRTLDRVVEREVQRQMFDVEQAGENVDNTYARLRDRFGDRQAAQTALRLLLADAEQAEINTMVARNADPQTALWAQQRHLEIEQKKLDLEDQFAARMYGQIQSRFQQGRAATAGGFVPMDGEKHANILAKYSGIAKTDAETIKTHGEAGQIAVDLENPDIPAGVREQVKEINDVNIALDSLNGLVKMWKGAVGIDRETGAVVGRSDGDIPGKGPIDAAYGSIPFVASEDKDYRARADQAHVDFLLNLAATTFTDNLFNRTKSMVNSADPEKHRAGIIMLSEGLARKRKELMSNLTPQTQKFLEKRRAEVGATSGDAKGPDRLEAKKSVVSP